MFISGFIFGILISIVFFFPVINSIHTTQDITIDDIDGIDDTGDTYTDYSFD